MKPAERDSSNGHIQKRNEKNKFAILQERHVLHARALAVFVLRNINDKKEIFE